MLNFNSPEKGLGLVSSPHAYDFSGETFLMLHSINWQVSLSDCLYFWRYWAICILQLFINQVVTSIRFEINLTFLIKLFCYMSKKSRKKYILRTERALRWNKKQFSALSKGFQFPKIVSDLTESALINLYLYMLKILNS